MLITFRTLNHVFYINSEDTIHFSNTVTKTVNLSILGGKVPDFLAKMVHFPPWPTRVPAPQASLAALGISTSRESAGFFRENGSLSPTACRGIGSTDLSGRTWHFHLRGKCRVFPRKRFTFPRGRPGCRLHRPLSPHSPFPPLGKVPDFLAKTVHFPPRERGENPATRKD